MDDDVTEVAADFMYLVVLGDEDIIEQIANALNVNYSNVNASNAQQYLSIDVDTQIDHLPETKRFRNMLNAKLRTNLNASNGSNTSSESTVSNASNIKYFVMGEGVETAQCYTYGEEDNVQKMLIEITENDESFVISFPVLNLDDEMNPDDMIDSWIKEKDLIDVIDNCNTKLINMVGTEHDILVFAAYVE